ncbi:hypothetical protein [Thalassotalea agarivorans]|uniref:DUF4367 domain-containing protein n=1 Tax=Thalassotalea agarivorans TaxID=349064 RepID=A0A1H9ZKL2_THASX|nr:hypothetical protein [Thalassotalea agarivorans]SES82242.1 hypothetical protein SAMN05660429_00493 [Thalassotalea agarivorans]
MNSLKHLIAFALMIAFLSACQSTQSGKYRLHKSAKPSENPSEHYVQVEHTPTKVLNLEGYEITSEEVDSIVAWRCKDFYEGGDTVFEIGFIKNFEMDTVGYILLSGETVASAAIYQRHGIKHRWDWGDDKLNYAVVLSHNGKGFYYDFSTADEKGMKSSADEIFKCSQISL